MKKEYLIRSIKVGILVVCLSAIYMFLDYLVTDDTAYMTRITFHDFYEMDRVDSLFIGASHGLRGVHAEMLSEQLQEEVFVAATSSQEMMGSYYILKDALTRYDLKNVYLEISPAIMKMDRERADTSTYIISDYMKDFSIKTQYLFHSFQSDEWIPAFFRVRRNFNSMKIEDIWEIPKKKAYNYKNYLVDEDVFGANEYQGRGTWIMERERSVLSDKNALSFDNVGREDLNPDVLALLSEIIGLCKEKDVHLTLYMLPYPEIYLYKYTDYDDFSSYFADLARERNLGWFDLNLVKNEYLNLKNEDFADNDHLNSDGNYKTTNFLARYLQNPGEYYFWNSLEEKNKEEKSDAHILAVEYEMETYDSIGENIEYWTQEGDYRIYTLSILSEDVKGVEYQVYHCYGLDEDKSIKGELIACKPIAQDVVSFIVPYEDRGNTIAIEVMDAETKEMLYRFVEYMY